VLAGAVSLVTSLPALAGGWAVVTLDELPQGVAAGKPTQIGFMVRQHGVTPMGGLAPKIRLWQSARSEAVEVVADPQGAPGHYVATITLLRAGTWEWSIDAFWPAQTMPSLTVVGAPQVSPIGSAPAPWTSAIAMVALGLVPIAGFAVLRKRTRLATGLIAVALVGALGTVALADAPTASGQVASPGAALNGQALFVAKGCIVCHAQASVNSIRSEMGLADFGVGPDLTGRTFSRSFLTSWLKDPQAIKPETMMPNLGLSEDEIKALTDFINAGKDD
jgi:cytochrome c2